MTRANNFPEMNVAAKFDPNDHMMDLKGKKYLPVAARIAWAQAEFPKGFSVEILSQTVQSWQEEDPRNKGKMRTVREAHTRVRVTFANGSFYDGSKSETTTDFGDFIEKSETGAIGRALALAGYGTMFAPEFDESATTSRAAGIEGVRIVDTPQALPERPAKRAVPPIAPEEDIPWEDPNPPASKSGKTSSSTNSASSAPVAPSVQDDLEAMDKDALRASLLGLIAGLKDGSGTPIPPYTQAVVDQVNGSISAVNQAHKVSRAGELPLPALRDLIRSVRQSLAAVSKAA